MTDASPWDEIAIPNADYNVRQIPSASACPCYWGRDSQGCNLFILELTGDHTAQFRRNVSAINGVDVDLRESGIAGVQRLVLTLERHVDRDLFEGLCRTLITSLGSATDAAGSLAVALAHIRRWKTFLSGKSGRLSGEQVRGLFAELRFLAELLETLTPDQAIEAWLGPDRSHQDFIFGNKAVEVKALSGKERSVVRISSEDQLESLNDALFLRVYRLSATPDAPDAWSLNGLTSRIQSRLSQTGATEAFEKKLAAQGYAPLPEYDEPLFAVSETMSFVVQGDFPKLIRSQLPTGVMSVSYDIALEDIENYRCDNGRILGG